MTINKLSGCYWASLSIMLCIPIVISGCCSPQPQWPEIQETKQTYRFIADKKETFTMTIFDKAGPPLYYIDARFNAWKYDDARDYDFSGLCECRLIPATAERQFHPSLFMNNKEATADWENVARFMHEELIGLAGAPSSRSIVQRCKVRGMYIELEINNIHANPDKDIINLDLTISFRNDPTATSEISDEDVVIAPVGHGGLPRGRIEGGLGSLSKGVRSIDIIPPPPKGGFHAL